MKWLGLALALGAAFYMGLMSANKSESKPTETLEGIRAEFERLSREELRDYEELKEKRLKYEAANKILARVMQIFIADLGLKTLKQRECKINSETSASTEPPPIPDPPPFVPPPSITPSPSAVAIASATRYDSGKTQRSRRPSRPGFSESGKRLAFPTEKAKGAVHALYQAVLWRAPDSGGGAEATARFSEDGWNQYLRNARNMVQSPEFLKDIEPNHTSNEIINRMYAVFMGRCSSKPEMNEHLQSLSGSGPGSVVSAIINKSRRNHSEQIFSGGFSPSSCPD